MDWRTPQPQPIGIIDSGAGGDRLRRVLQSYLPQELFLSVSDKENFPYGNKSCGFLFARTAKQIERLRELDCKVIILGCGTLSALVFPEVQSLTRIPILDMITPVAKWLSLGSDVVGIIGTQNTIASEKWERQLQLKQGRFYTCACPELATAIERGVSGEQLRQVIRQQTLSLPKVDYLLLGCTHYPRAWADFKKVFSTTYLIDPALFLVAELGRTLKEVNYVLNRS